MLEASYERRLSSHYAAIRARFYPPTKRSLRLASVAPVEAPPEPIVVLGEPELEPERLPEPISLLGPAGPEFVFAYIEMAHGVSRPLMLSSARVAQVISARRHLMYLLHSHCGLSTRRVGALVDGRDHKGVMRAIARHLHEARGAVAA